MHTAEKMFQILRWASHTMPIGCEYDQAFKFLHLVVMTQNLKVVD